MTTRRTYNNRSKDSSLNNSGSYSSNYSSELNDSSVYRDYLKRQDSFRNESYEVSEDEEPSPPTSKYSASKLYPPLSDHSPSLPVKATTRALTPARCPTPAPPKIKPVQRVTKKENDTGGISMSFVVVTLILLFVSFLFIKAYLIGLNQPDECQIALRRLRDDHPEQDKIMINSIVRASKSLREGKDHPIHSIVLLYSSQSSPSFINDVLTNSVHCTSSGHSNPVVLQRHNFTKQMENDYGNVLTTFGDQLKKEGIMMVLDVNQLPFGVAPAFHALCDSENPWTKPAAIYFSIQVPDGVQVSEDDNLDHLAIRLLKDQWKQLPSNILDPLITRITDQVLYVR